MIGAKVKLLLDKNNITAKDLSVATKIPLSTLADLLTGKTKNLSVQKARKICEALNCTLDYLLDDSIAEEVAQVIKRAPVPLDAEDKKLLALFGGMNEEGKSRLLELAAMFARNKKYRKGNK
ncbi:MAG: helix-turn-helix domain-containing protein [Acidaminococcales bacterium]|jgi:transcriptional regulator with XRE-family HTH domain|nr:helix-turn-helix domain-containing protein [Acidaminococcales bacterium]